MKYFQDQLASRPFLHDQSALNMPGDAFRSSLKYYNAYWLSSIIVLYSYLRRALCLPANPAGRRPNP